MGESDHNVPYDKFEAAMEKNIEASVKDLVGTYSRIHVNLGQDSRLSDIESAAILEAASLIDGDVDGYLRTYNKLLEAEFPMIDRNNEHVHASIIRSAGFLYLTNCFSTLADIMDSPKDFY